MPLESPHLTQQSLTPACCQHRCEQGKRWKLANNLLPPELTLSHSKSLSGLSGFILPSRNPTIQDLGQAEKFPPYPLARSGSCGHSRRDSCLMDAWLFNSWTSRHRQGSYSLSTVSSGSLPLRLPATQHPASRPRAPPTFRLKQQLHGICSSMKIRPQQ